jgi:hypothetical protein
MASEGIFIVKRTWVCTSRGRGRVKATPVAEMFSVIAAISPVAVKSRKGI